MTEKTRKPLSLKNKPTTQASAESPTQSTRRTKKRIIRRDELPTSKLANTKKPPKPHPKKQSGTPPNKPITSPSDIRLDNLNASLNAFDTWRNFQPLTLGVEKQVFQHIAKHQLSCSKRVVQRLLRAHVKNPKYLQATIDGLVRLNLDGTEAEVILQSEKDYAVQLNSTLR